MKGVKKEVKKKSDPRRFLFPAAAAAFLILLLYIFLVVNEKTGRPVFGFHGTDNRLIELKLSPDDLIALNNRENTQWVTVRLIESEMKSFRIKIRPLLHSVMDFQLNVDGTVYNLFKLTKHREPYYELFKQADIHEVQQSSPLQVQLKINAVLIGTYLMEELVYEQLRDDKGNFYVRLNTDTYRLRKVRYEVENGYTGLMNRYFKRKELARCLVFFSLFPHGTPGSPLPLERLVFRFEAHEEKFRPYLMLESILPVPDNAEEEPSFEIPSEKKKFKGKDIDALVRRTRNTPYARFVDAALTGIDFDKKK
jgi:hypothetical protein